MMCVAASACTCCQSLSYVIIRIATGLAFVEIPQLTLTHLNTGLHCPNPKEAGFHSVRLVPEKLVSGDKHVFLAVY